MRRMMALVASAMALTGCVTTYKQVPTLLRSDGPQAVRFAHGNALMMSESQRGSVWLIPARYYSGNHIYFEVVAFNHTGDPINFGTEDITLETGDGVRLPVHDFDHLKHQARKQAEAELVTAMVVSGIEAWHAERVSRRDPEAGARIWRHSEREFFATAEAINYQLEDAVAAYSRLALQTTTVDPFTAFGGVVFTDQIAVPSRGSRELVANVRFAGEDHKFRLRIAAEGTPTPVQTGLPAIRREVVQEAQHHPQTWMWTGNR